MSRRSRRKSPRAKKASTEVTNIGGPGFTFRLKMAAAATVKFIVGLLRRYTRPRMYKLGALILLISAGLYFIYMIGVMDFVDDWTERNFIAYADRRTDREVGRGSLRLIVVEDSPVGDVPSGGASKSHRKFHADLIRALAGAGAKVVALDIYFEDPTEWDSQLAQAIEAAADAGTPIIVGVNGVKDGTPLSDMPELIKGAVKDKWGDITVGGQSAGTNYVRFIKLVNSATAETSADVRQNEIRVTPSFALQVIIQSLAPQSVTAYYNEDKDQVLLRSPDGRVVKVIPVDDELGFLIRWVDKDALEDVSRSYHDVYDNRNNPQFMSYFKDKIVLVGYMKDESRDVSASEQRLGVQIQGNAILNILKDDYLHRLSPIRDFLIYLGMALIGAVAQWRFRGRFDIKIPVEIKNVGFTLAIPTLLVLFTVFYWFMAVLAYKHQRLILLSAYHILSLFIAYWTCGFALRKRYV